MFWSATRQAMRKKERSKKLLLERRTCSRCWGIPGQSPAIRHITTRRKPYSLTRMGADLSFALCILFDINRWDHLVKCYLKKIVSWFWSGPTWVCPKTIVRQCMVTARRMALDFIGNKKFHAKPQSRKVFFGSVLCVLASLREPENYFQ